MSSWVLTGSQENYGKQVESFHVEEEKEKNTVLQGLSQWILTNSHEHHPPHPHPVMQLLESLSAPIP